MQISKLIKTLEQYIPKEKYKQALFFGALVLPTYKIYTFVHYYFSELHKYQHITDTIKSNPEALKKIRRFKYCHPLLKESSFQHTSHRSLYPSDESRTKVLETHWKPYIEMNEGLAILFGKIISKKIEKSEKIENTADLVKLLSEEITELVTHDNNKHMQILYTKDTKPNNPLVIDSKTIDVIAEILCSLYFNDSFSPYRNNNESSYHDIFAEELKIFNDNHQQFAKCFTDFKSSEICLNETKKKRLSLTSTYFIHTYSGMLIHTLNRRPLSGKAPLSIPTSLKNNPSLFRKIMWLGRFCRIINTTPNEDLKNECRKIVDFKIIPYKSGDPHTCKKRGELIKRIDGKLAELRKVVDQKSKIEQQYNYKALVIDGPNNPYARELQEKINNIRPIQEELSELYKEVADLDEVQKFAIVMKKYLESRKT